MATNSGDDGVRVHLKQATWKRLRAAAAADGTDVANVVENLIERGLVRRTAAASPATATKADRRGDGFIR